MQPILKRTLEAVSKGVKLPKREAELSLLSSAEVTNERKYTSISPIRLSGAHRDNITVFIYIVL
jgi:hypothetical protein